MKERYEGTLDYTIEVKVRFKVSLPTDVDRKLNNEKFKDYVEQIFMSKLRTENHDGLTFSTPDVINMKTRFSPEVEKVLQENFEATFGK